MTDGPSGFDLSAAWLRKAQGDLRAFMEGFAARLDGALPGRVQVQRKRDGLFSSTSHVVAVAIECEHNTYKLAFERGHISAQRCKSVRGVTLKSEPLAMPDWLAALQEDIRLLSEHAGAAQSVLHDFLMN